MRYRTMNACIDWDTLVATCVIETVAETLSAAQNKQNTTRKKVYHWTSKLTNREVGATQTYCQRPPYRQQWDTCASVRISEFRSLLSLVHRYK